MKIATKQNGVHMDFSEATAFLSRATLFAPFAREELSFIAEQSELVLYSDGEGIFEPGDQGNCLYLVVSGSVVILSSQDKSVIAEFVSGDSFGELELLTKTSRNAGARANGATHLLTFPARGQDFESALASHPEVSARILRSFLLVISGRTRKANALVKENSPWVRELKRQVYGDKLTGLLNKAYLDENLPKMLLEPTALVMMKPDNFKEINDAFGHEVGDAVLVYMANELAREVEKNGTAIRYMGNELAVIYPKMDKKNAIQAAQSIQARLSSLDLSSYTGNDHLRLSLSLGIAIFPEHGPDAESLVKACAGLPLVARGRGGSLILFPEDG